MAMLNNQSIKDKFHFVFWNGETLTEFMGWPTQAAYPLEFQQLQSQIVGTICLISLYLRVHPMVSSFNRQTNDKTH
jgi:hypothetical protein